MRALSLAFLVIFFGFAALPLTARYLKVADVKLFGVTALVQPVPFSWEAFREGKFQEAFEPSFDEHLGFRTYAIRADNELNYRVFRQLGYNPHTSIVLGKDDYIYDRGYVDAFNNRFEVPAEEIEARVKRLLAIQQYMEARGKTLLVLITPSKAVLYSEYLPDSLIDHDRQLVPSNYEKLVILLQKHGVHYFDAEGYLAAMKSKVPFTFFTNSGIHWGDPAACEVSARVLERIGAQLGRRTPRLQCKPYRISADVRREDTDVLDVCNLWSPERLVRPAYYAQPRITPGDTLPSMLIVGGSFNRALIRYLNKARVRDTPLYYYYSKLEFRGRSVPIDKAAIDFEHQVFEKDVLLIEVNAEVVNVLGFDFVEDAARAVEKLKN